ncbi:MAG TPA: hypothetical protein VGU74_13065 [Gemmatimonadales bacterium]|nr:hypothetical protein [Gemmatimonadales bacterium]
MDAMSRRAFAERLALAVAAPYLIGESPPPASPRSGAARPERSEGERELGGEVQQQEPSALAKALADGIRLRYPDRFSADDLATITRGIDTRLRQIERLYQTTLTNADEPDFVYSVYRGAD